MMKKSLILMLVLGMATIANAALQISVGGNQEPVDSQINIAQSDHLILDIWTDSLIEPQVGEGYWALVCATADATITGGASLILDEPGISIYTGGGVPAVPDGQDGVWGGIALSTISDIQAGTTIYDDIDFHCEWAPNDVTITLYFGAGPGAWTAVDRVIVHQIPEPATMVLLGLGGLLLRRRK